MANILVITNSGHPIILTDVSLNTFKVDIHGAYITKTIGDNPIVVKTYREQAMGDIELILRQVAYYREI